MRACERGQVRVLVVHVFGSDGGCRVPWCACRADAVEEAAAGKSKAIAQFVTHARGYVNLLREHIEKEDHCLFTMANQTLTFAAHQN